MQTSNGVKPEIFREYDVRGVYPGDLNEDVAYRIATAFVRYLSKNRLFGEVVVGRDIRLSSPALFESAKSAILDQGRDVIDIGVATTPLFYFSVGKSRAAGGLMITASHNPPQYNGIKFVKEDAFPVIFQGGIEVIKKLAMDDVLPKKLHSGQSAVKDYSGEYLEILEKHAQIRRIIRVCADASNGVGGALLERLFNKLGVQFGALYFEPDGSFPNHPPNPSLPEALVDLQKNVISGGFELGIILDADGDRVVFVDEDGRVILSDIIAAWLADALLKEGDHMILDYRSSRVVAEAVKRKNGILILSKAGHSNIKQAMRENGAVFAAELSGHFYFKDFYYADSALLAIVRVLSRFSESTKKISEIVRPYQKYFHSGEINFEISDKEKVIEKIQKDYSSGVQNFQDGLTVYFPDWWFNLRPSNTEPLLRLVVEADNKELMEERRDELIAKIKPPS